MEEERAHQLYQQFQKVDAAAKQKQGLGFGACSVAIPDVKPAQDTNGWQAPYKLSDKYQQVTDNTKRKRSRSPSHNKTPPDAVKRHRNRASVSPGSPGHAAQRQHRDSCHRSDSKRRDTARRRDSTKSAHNDRHRRHTHREVSPADHHRHGNRDTRHYSRHRSDRDRRSSNPHTDHSSDRHRSAGKHHESRNRTDSRSNSRPTPKPTKAPDYAKLISGYSSMSDAQRLRAVTQYKLRKTSSKDQAGQDGRPWTRFVFNNDALLEEEGAAPDSPGLEGRGQAGLGAFDFRQHRSANPGKSAEDAHEAAIFGAPVAEPPREPSQRQACASSSESDERPQVVELHEISAFGNDAVSDVLTAGESDLNVPKLSWRERALLKKQQTVETGSGSAVR